MKSNDIIEIIDNLAQSLDAGRPKMETQSKYQFSRAKWYESKLPRDGQAAFAWCTEQFGPEPTYTDAWTRWYFNVDRTFRFRDEQDYLLFLLRWAQ
jgi:hypothetical protein